MDSQIYTVSAAHRIAGKARGTIINHMKAGKLSFEKDGQGNPMIGASELIRVYGKRCDFDKANKKHVTTAELNRQPFVQIDKLEQSLTLTEQENRHLRDKIDMQSSHNDRLNDLLDEANKQISATQTLLTDERSKRDGLQQELTSRKHGLLARLFGAG